jgi:DnaJ-domain-containing protein 1
VKETIGGKDSQRGAMIEASAGRPPSMMLKCAGAAIFLVLCLAGQWGVFLLFLLIAVGAFYLRRAPSVEAERTGSAQEQREREQARRRQEEQEEARRQQERVWEQEQQQRNQQEARAQQARQQAQVREKEHREQRAKEQREKEQREQEQARRRQEDQQERAEERRAKSNGTEAQDWWVVLGTAPDATLETARQAYRLKIKQYHPDRVEGLGPEFTQLADQKSKELNAALAEAKRYARTGSEPSL